MTCKQEFLVLENGERLFCLGASQLLCRLGARTPSFFSGRSLCRQIHPRTNDRSIYPRRVCRALLLVFASLQLDARWMRTAVGQYRILVLFFPRTDDRARGGRDRACRCISGMLEIDFGVSDLSAVLDFGVGAPGLRVCPPDSALRFRLPVKGNGQVCTV